MEGTKKVEWEAQGKWKEAAGGGNIVWKEIVMLCERIQEVEKVRM